MARFLLSAFQPTSDHLMPVGIGQADGVGRVDDTDHQREAVGVDAHVRSGMTMLIGVVDHPDGARPRRKDGKPSDATESEKGQRCAPDDTPVGLSRASRAPMIAGDGLRPASLCPSEASTASTRKTAPPCIHARQHLRPVLGLGAAAPA